MEHWLQPLTIRIAIGKNDDDVDVLPILYTGKTWTDKEWKTKQEWNQKL